MVRFFSCFTESPNVGHKICIVYNEQKMTKIVSNLFKTTKKRNYNNFEFFKNQKNNKGIKKLIMKKEQEKNNLKQKKTIKFQN